MAVSESQIRAKNKYEKENMFKFQVMINRNTDPDIIEQLEKINAMGISRNGYIKELIRADISKKNNTRKFGVI